MRPFILGFLLCALAVYLSACGFTPLYSNQKTIESLSSIEIDVIPNQEGQFLRNVLIDRFYNNGMPLTSTYKLTIAPLQERRKDLDVTITSDTTRAQMMLSSRLTLTEISTGKTLLQRPLKSITSYNVLGSEFATRVTEKNARENALDNIARQIEKALVLYLGRTL